jgi:hypothetical protein
MEGKEEISSDLLLLLLLLPSCRLSIHGNATHSFDCPTADLQIHRTFGVPNSKEQPFTFLLC